MFFSFLSPVSLIIPCEEAFHGFQRTGELGHCLWGQAGCAPCPGALQVFGSAGIIVLHVQQQWGEQGQEFGVCVTTVTSQGSCVGQGGLSPAPCPSGGCGQPQGLAVGVAEAALAAGWIAVSGLADGEGMNCAGGAEAARAGVKLYHPPCPVILHLLWVTVGNVCSKTAEMFGVCF